MKIIFKKPANLFDKDQVEVVQQFIKFLQGEIPLNKDTHIYFLNKRKEPMTTGVRMPYHEIYVLSAQRMLIDILRTLGHEWVHEFQHQKLGLRDDQPIQDIGGKEENMANALGGVMVKKFERVFPKYENLLYAEK